MTPTKDTTTRRHGTDATKIIDNNQITRRNNFRSEEVFPRPWNVAIDYVPDVTPYPRIRIFFNRQRFFLRIRFPSTRIRWIRPAYESATFLIRSPEWKFLNTLWIRKFVDARSGIFLIRWRKKIEPSSLPWKAEQDSNFARFTTYALLPIFPEESGESV